MSDPDLEGFVRMEGVKGKRYLAIKGDLMAYYNTYNVSFAVNRLYCDYLLLANSVQPATVGHNICFEKFRKKNVVPMHIMYLHHFIL